LSSVRRRGKHTEHVYGERQQGVRPGKGFCRGIRLMAARERVCPCFSPPGTIAQFIMRLPWYPDTLTVFVFNGDFIVFIKDYIDKDLLPDRCLINAGGYSIQRGFVKGSV
jgi:hypothetical protein